MAIILTMKHFKGTQHEQPVSPEKTFTVNTHAEKKKKPYIYLHACSSPPGRPTSAQQLHTSEQKSKHTAFTVDLVVPRRISHVPKTKYLQTYFIFYLHSHPAFCMFVLECAKTCMCQCVHVLCRSCLLRR